MFGSDGMDSVDLDLLEDISREVESNDRDVATGGDQYAGSRLEHGQS